MPIRPCFQGELAFRAITSTPASVREPEGNGGAERSENDPVKIRDPLGLFAVGIDVPGVVPRRPSCVRQRDASRAGAVRKSVRAGNEQAAARKAEAERQLQ